MKILLFGDNIALPRKLSNPDCQTSERMSDPSLIIKEKILAVLEDVEDHKKRERGSFSSELDHQEQNIQPIEEP